MKNKNTLFLTQAAMIAALYVVLTLIANSFGLASMAIQVRFSEALAILPFFTFAAVPGLLAGCLVSNLITGAVPLDIIFGSLATLIGALGTYTLRKHKWLAPLPPILANTIVIPILLAYVYQFEGSLLYFILTVAIGESVSCGALGMCLLFALNKYRNILFSSN